MPITIAEFYSDLRTVIARGNAVDSSIPVWARNSLKFLEREITFDYMKVMFFLLMKPGAKFFDFAAQDPPIPLKGVEALGYYGQDGGMIPLKRINVKSIGRNAADSPVQYRVAGTRIIFEGAIDPPGLTTSTTSYPLVLHTSLFTKWPTDSGATHPILGLADDLLKHQVLLNSAISVRKQEEMAGWKVMRDEALGGVRRLQDGNDFEDDNSMVYRGGTTGRLFPNISDAVASIQGMYDVPSTFGIEGIYWVGQDRSGLFLGEEDVNLPDTTPNILLESGEDIELEGGGHVDLEVA